MCSNDHVIKLEIFPKRLFYNQVSPLLYYQKCIQHMAHFFQQPRLSMLSIGIITDMFGVRTIYIIASILILCSACLSFSLLKYHKTEQNDISI